MHDPEWDEAFCCIDVGWGGVGVGLHGWVSDGVGYEDV